MRVSTSDVKKTVDVILRDLTMEELNSLETALEAGLVALREKAKGMTIAGYSPAAVNEARNAFFDARRAIDGDDIKVSSDA